MHSASAVDIHRGVRLKRGSGYGTDAERILRNGTDMGLKCVTERNGYGVKTRNGTERIWG